MIRTLLLFLVHATVPKAFCAKCQRNQTVLTGRVFEALFQNSHK